MSLISITPFTDGAVLSTTTVNEMFDSFTEINGKLGSAHVTSLTGGLDHRHLQLGSTSGGTMVGGTANLDYFNGVRYYLHRNQKNNDTSQSMGYYDSGYLRYLRSSTNIDSALPGSTTLPLRTQSGLSPSPELRSRSTCRSRPMYL